jgi:hypothetical protein
MIGIIDWARDLLVSRGALVETETAGALRAMLPAELAASLESGEWLSLRFGAGAGSDDENEWLDRLSRLLPADARVVSARLRRPTVVPPVDAAGALDRGLALQNGIYRVLEDHQQTARYCFFGFHYTIESDETSLGVVTICLNASARSLVLQPEFLLKAVKDDLEEDPQPAVSRDELAQLYPIALRAAQPDIRRLAAGIEQSSNRRLARDTERIDSYYKDLLRQIEKRISRHSAAPEVAGKERSRAAATQLDRSAKLEDLVRKYSLKIRIQPGDVLAVSLPVREISTRLIRKKVERVAKLHWNPKLGALESPWCEGCSAAAYPLFLCEDRVHFLCKSCAAPCPHCGKHFCRACQPRCKCGGSSRDHGKS